MPEISSNARIARFVSGDKSADLSARQSHGTFASHAEAQAKAKEIADSADQDAVILETEAGFEVLATDEIHSLMPGGSFNGEVFREAPIVSFVSTDPLSGEEQVIGKQSGGPAAPAEQATQRPTALDTYAQRYQKQLNKLLGAEKAATLAEMNQLIHALEANGMKVSIELDDDVFENKESLLGFKNMLVYAHQNFEALQQRSIREIAIVDEWDGIFGTKVDLEYDKKAGTRRLEIGDDFLNDWGDSLKFEDADSLEKLQEGLGEPLKDAELEVRSQTFQQMRGKLSTAFEQVNNLQQHSLRSSSPPDYRATLNEIESQINELEREVIPDAKKAFGDFSVKQERKTSLKHLETFEDTLKALRKQIDSIKAQQGLQGLELNARLEKLKLVLLKGSRDLPDQRNYLGSYVAGLGSSGKPSMGMEYARTLGADRNTVASLRAGSSAPLTSKGVNTSDIMLGLGVSHTFHSRNKLLDGSTVGVGIGFSRETPFMIGASASNSWQLNPNFHGLNGQTSVVGGLHATVGTYTNVGATLDVHKQLGSRVDFEGYGEVSLWNQAAEAEAELALSKSKSVYLTGGVGTNKLIYGGVGFADKYELEVGLGGISFGKDSNHLPGESGWEAGIKLIPLPMPFFRHHRVPGYQFTYGDKSTEYITPNGTFMTIKENAQGDKVREAYVPDPKAAAKAADKQSIIYRRVTSQAELEDLDNAPAREISLGPLGYLTVVDNGETLIKDGLIQKPLTEAELGIITDQAGVLWFDRMNPESQHHSLGTRREEIPLPLYRAVHY